MQIQIHTDRNIHGHESLTAAVHASVEKALKRFRERITRLEVHVGDENAAKHGRDDKRCMMEARLEGHQPLAVTEHADTVVQAIDGAVKKLAHLLEHTLGRLHSHRNHAAAPLSAEQDDAEAPETQRATTPRG